MANPTVRRPAVRRDLAALARLFGERLSDAAERTVPGHQLFLGLLLFLALSLSAMWDASATYDEPAHLAAAYTAVVAEDYRLLAEQPPLGRRIAALPLLALEVTVPWDHESWRTGDYFTFGFVFLHRSGLDADSILFAARVAMLFWGALLVASVFAVAREILGPVGGLVSLLVAVFNPTILAHAHLVTTDVPAAALMFLATVAWMRWTRVGNLFNTVAAGILLGGAFAAKFSAVLLWPVLPVLALMSAVGRRPDADAGQGAAGPARARLKPAAARAASLVVMGAVAYAVVWGAYGFRFEASPEAGVDLTEGMRFGRFDSTLPALLASWRVLPEACLYGLSELANHASEGNPAYALGYQSSKGWWWFFPFAFLVKSPISFLALAAMGVVGCWRRGRLQGAWEIDGMLAALLVMGSFVLHSPLNLGIRYLLPLIPFLCVLAGGSVEGGPDRGRPGLPLRMGLLAALAFECLLAAPFYLAYFNATALLGERHRILVDSNLDWGQDLRRLKSFMVEHEIPRIKLAYHGCADPKALDIDHEVLPGWNYYSKVDPAWRTATDVVPGDIIAVSANCLAGLGYEPMADMYRRLLEGQSCIARIGHSILVFQILQHRRVEW